MNKIKLLTLATVTSTGIGLSSCVHPMTDSINQNKAIVATSGISTDKFTKIERRLENTIKDGVTFAVTNDGINEAEEALRWQKVADSVFCAKKVKHAIDSTRKAVLDSLKRTIK